MADKQPRDTDSNERLEEQLTRANERLEKLEAAFREASLLSSLQRQPRESDGLDLPEEDTAVVRARQDHAVTSPETLSDPAQQAEALFRHGVAACQHGDYDQAIADWQQVLTLQPGNAYASTNIGIVLAEQARWQEAREMFSQALRSQPDNAEAHYGLGMANAQLGDYAAAIDAWEQTLRLQPDYSDALYNLAVVRQRMGQDAINAAVARQARSARPPAAQKRSKRDSTLPPAVPVEPSDNNPQPESKNGAHKTSNLTSPTNAREEGREQNGRRGEGEKGSNPKSDGREEEANRQSKIENRKSTKVWLRNGILAVAGAALIVAVIVSGRSSAEKHKQPAAQPYSGKPAVTPASKTAAASALPAPIAAPAAAESSQGGRIRLRLEKGLTGRFSYWFVSNGDQTVHLKSLPLPGPDGLILLPIPAAYNQPGAQLRVLDDTQGKVARLPVVDFSRQPIFAKQRLGPNLLHNADFTTNLESWTLEMDSPQASARAQILDGLDIPPGVAGRVVRFDVLALGAQDWHAQFYQKGLDLAEGQQYRLAFWAKADRKRSLRVDATLDHPDFHKVGLDRTFALTSQWRKYEETFTAMRTEPAHTHLSFALGGSLGEIEMAGVSLRPVQGADVLQPASPDAALTLSRTDFN